MTKALNQNHHTIILLLLTAIGFICLAGNLGGRDLWAPDEPRYAEIAREMIQNDDYFLPRLNCEIYTNKPPGFFWLIILFSAPAGEVTHITARMPSVFFAILTLILLYQWLRRQHVPLPPWSASLILLTSYLFWWFGGRANIDISFAFFISLAAVLFHIGTHQPVRRFSVTYAIAYLAMGIALIIKGPFALLPFAIILFYLIQKKDFSAIKKLQIPSGLALIMIPAIIWLIPAISRGGYEYFQLAVLHQVGSRITESISHPHPFYYYLYMLPLNFMPWSAFLVITIIEISRRKVPVNDTLLYSLIWLTTSLAVFSLISAKQSHYLLPLFPAAAVITAHFINSPNVRWHITAGRIILMLILLAGLIAPFPAIRKNPLYVFPIITLSLTLVISATIALCYLRRNTNPTSLLLALSTLMIINFFITQIWLLPAINTYKSIRPIIAPYSEFGSNAPFATFSLTYFNYPFFTGQCVHNCVSVDDFKKFNAIEGTKYLLIQKRDTRLLPQNLFSNYSILRERKISRKILLLCKSNDPAP